MIAAEFKFICSSIHDYSYYVDKHYHDCYEIVYYTEGYGNVNIDGINYQFKPNTFAITSPGTIHDEKSGEVIVGLTYIGFELKQNDYILKNGVFSDDKNKTVLKLIEKINEENKNKLFSFKDLIDVLMSELAIQIARVQNKDYVLEDKTNYDQIESYIRCNCNKHINGKSVAKGVGYNYDYFRKMFKNHFGISIRDFIIKVKLENSITLLKTKKYSTKEVAKLVGFNSPSHFISVFKEFYKTTPALYMKKIDLNNVSKDKANYKKFDKLK